MSKKVRIENADTSNFKVIVQIWDKGQKNSVGNDPDTMAHEIFLNNPCDITGPEVYVTSTRYLVVKEA